MTGLILHSQHFGSSGKTSVKDFLFFIFFKL